MKAFGLGLLVASVSAAKTLYGPVLQRVQRIIENGNDISIFDAFDNQNMDQFTADLMQTEDFKSEIWVKGALAVENNGL